MSPPSQGQPSGVNGHHEGGVAARLARKNILELHPYRCARDDYSEGILLDANENAYGPPIPRNVEDNESNDIVLERYPDPYQIPLKKKFAKFRGVEGITTAHMFAGVGSDEAIDLLMRIFCCPGGEDQILITPPTYGMYKVCAKVNDIPIVTVPLTPTFDVEIPKVSSVDCNITPSFFWFAFVFPEDPLVVFFFYGSILTKSSWCRFWKRSHPQPNCCSCVPQETRRRELCPCRTLKRSFQLRRMFWWSWTKPMLTTRRMVLLCLSF